MLRAIIVAASIGAAAYGFSKTDSISRILSDPGRWDGRHVTIVGKIGNLEERTALNGRAYDVFSLCAGTCMRVFMDGRPKLTEGRTLTVNGVFSAAKRIGGIQLPNDVQADSEELK